MIRRKRRSTNETMESRHAMMVKGKGAPSLAKLTVMKMNQSARRFLSFRVPKQPPTDSKEIQFQPEPVNKQRRPQPSLMNTKQAMGVSVESVLDDMYLEEESFHSGSCKEEETVEQQRDIVLTPARRAARKPPAALSPPRRFVDNNNHIHHDNHDTSSPTCHSFTEFSQECTTTKARKQQRSVTRTPQKQPKGPRNQPSLKDFLASDPSPLHSLGAKSLHGDARRQNYANTPRKEFASMRDFISEYESIVGDD